MRCDILWCIFSKRLSRLLTFEMSDLSDARFREEEHISDDFSSSLDSGFSAGITPNDAPNDEEVSLFSPSELSWTDTKHNFYLEYLEANFVQNMFAKCYCAEDLCGEASRRLCHEHMKDQGHFNSDENVFYNYYSAHAFLKSQTSHQNTRNTDTDNSNMDSVSKSKDTGDPTSVPLEKSWVQNLRPDKWFSESLSATEAHSTHHNGMTCIGSEQMAPLKKRYPAQKQVGARQRTKY
ncbi:hypothetical protein KP509_24G075300 [Ceratopteris richardii]|uniref:Uncharacterized protein n=1 Tax=Ceratopteris richardii TaxID=49495 RepID=A0A8T2RYR1_CERRI|nr:hypothetical protein KP509_24G075300 [Ceratopteris richardii]